MRLNHEDIARLIPHQGSMCLLAGVDDWDAQCLSACADSHRDPANPLRQHGRLGAACAIEYAAQAMALHGTLSSQRTDAPRAGYLVSVREVRLEVATLNDLDADLDIEVEQLMGDDNNRMYRFAVRAAGRPVASGRAAVRLDADKGETA
ncbi:3-hydroxylacyl-ACP dehydratase [Neisseriaceae bacterium JH1-16]|nr:3-hydroxylacyl-ACP dehydratase [Neisseriaceae bacterium JH1-16]